MEISAEIEAEIGVEIGAEISMVIGAKFATKIRAKIIAKIGTKICAEINTQKSEQNLDLNGTFYMFLMGIQPVYRIGVQIPQHQPKVHRSKKDHYKCCRHVPKITHVMQANLTMTK